MNCSDCTTKSCKTEYRDCNSNRDNIIKKYSNNEEQKIYQTADNLVNNGKAGKLSRIEELILFIKENNYKTISLAYCFSMEENVRKIVKLLRDNTINTKSYRCTINGIKEDDILKNNKKNVNCNPIGQAQAINNSNTDFVIELGLCLGHDVLFHKYLKKPFTVLAVKDRVFDNCPLNYLNTK